MSKDQAWEALKSGDRAQAERLFVSVLEQDNRDVSALLGLARVRILQKRLDDAQKLAQAASVVDNNPLVQLLHAELLGARGNRKEAIERVGHLLSVHTDMPLAQAVLAEQQIRMGFWDGGTKLFTRALTSEPGGQVFLQLQKVCADMTEAVAAGKVSAEDAARFTNKLDSALPRTQSHISTFLATVRRALSSAQALDLTQLSPQNRPTSQPASRPAQQAAQPRPNTTPPQQQQRQARAPQAPPRPSLIPPGRAANFLKSINEARSENAMLQDLVESLPPMSWPSDRQDMIDTIEPLAADTLSISELFQINRRQVMQVTHGSILTEIYLERARHALELVQRGPLAQPVLYLPTELSRLEINMLDGLMQHLQPIITADLGIEISTRAELAALGALIGECVARRFRGTWEYDTVPERSTVVVGGVKLEPFTVAQRWLAASTSEGSGLDELVSTARASVPITGALIGPVEAHIDLTAGLSGRLLEVRLAEQWALYRNACARSNTVELANDIRVTMDHPELITFTLDRAWLPPSAQLVEGRGAMVYLRNTGEFVCGWQPRAAARAARIAAQRLDVVEEQRGAGVAIQVLANTLMLGGVPIADEATAKRLNNQLGRELVHAPRADMAGAIHRITIWTLHDGTDLHKWTLEAPLAEQTPWRVTKG